MTTLIDNFNRPDGPLGTAVNGEPWSLYSVWGYPEPTGQEWKISNGRLVNDDYGYNEYATVIDTGIPLKDLIGLRFTLNVESFFGFDWQVFQVHFGVDPNAPTDSSGTPDRGRITFDMEPGGFTAVNGLVVEPDWMAVWGDPFTFGRNVDHDVQVGFEEVELPSQDLTLQVTVTVDDAQVFQDVIPPADWSRIQNRTGIGFGIFGPPGEVRVDDLFITEPITGPRALAADLQVQAGLYAGDEVGLAADMEASAGVEAFLREPPLRTVDRFNHPDGPLHGQQAMNGYTWDVSNDSFEVQDGLAVGVGRGVAAIYDPSADGVHQDSVLTVDVRDFVNYGGASPGRDVRAWFLMGGHFTTNRDPRQYLYGFGVLAQYDTSTETVVFDIRSSPDTAFDYLWQRVGATTYAVPRASLPDDFNLTLRAVRLSSSFRLILEIDGVEVITGNQAVIAQNPWRANIMPGQGLAMASVPDNNELPGALPPFKVARIAVNRLDSDPATRTVDDFERPDGTLAGTEAANGQTWEHVGGSPERYQIDDGRLRFEPLSGIYARLPDPSAPVQLRSSVTWQLRNFYQDMTHSWGINLRYGAGGGPNPNNPNFGYGFWFDIARSGNNVNIIIRRGRGSTSSSFLGSATSIPRANFPDDADLTFRVVPDPFGSSLIAHTLLNGARIKQEFLTVANWEESTAGGYGFWVDGFSTGGQAVFEIEGIFVRAFTVPAVDLGGVELESAFTVDANFDEPMAAELESAFELDAQEGMWLAELTSSFDVSPLLLPKLQVTGWYIAHLHPAGHLDDVLSWGGVVGPSLVSQTAVGRPTLIHNGLAGFHILRLVGNESEDDHFRLITDPSNLPFFTPTVGGTWFMVAKPTPTVGAGRRARLSFNRNVQQPEPGEYWEFAMTANSYPSLRAWNGTQDGIGFDTADHTLVGQWCLLTGWMDFANGIHYVRNFGEQILYIEDEAGAAGTFNLKYMFLDNNWDVAELIFFNSPLPIGDVEAIEGMLREQYFPKSSFTLNAQLTAAAGLEADLTARAVAISAALGGVVDVLANLRARTRVRSLLPITAHTTGWVGVTERSRPTPPSAPPEWVPVTPASPLTTPRGPGRSIHMPARGRR